MDAVDRVVAAHTRPRHGAARDLLGGGEHFVHGGGHLIDLGLWMVSGGDMATTLYRSTGYTLSHLVAEISHRNIALPDMQRPFVCPAPFGALGLSRLSHRTEH